MFCFILILSIITSTVDLSSIVIMSGTGTLSQQNNHKNISLLLDNLLRGYDNSIRPDFGGPPTIIEVDIMVRSMGPISEIDMTYSMDCYFRQSWRDKRLSFFSHTNYTLALSISMLAKIWKPDTFFYNGKQSYLHTITTPNKFVRLHHDGRVLYSSRLTIKAGCPMNLENFPMDIQKCPLTFGSFGYTKKDVLYRWNFARQVAIADDMKLSQFDLIGTPSGNNSFNPFNGDIRSEYSVLLVSFHLQRHMGNFLIQVYGPCVLLVVLSWVSFWLNREATADRVSLGITTVLTMTFLGLEARTNLPKVPYPTALDFFVFLSFAFIFATIIQFAVVHYFTKYGSGECYFSFSSDSSSEDEDSNTSYVQPKASKSVAKSVHECSKPNPRFDEIIQLTDDLLPSTSTKPATKPPARRLSHQAPPTAKRRFSVASRRVSTQSSKGYRKKKRSPRFNSVSKIDRVSRILFPFLFIAINTFYWYSYL
ncbi:gamma-aminobutyric acid receptor alpha-like [Diabrotica virgifera virgifera]|uniref:Gamma-aminobutyric acid receptor alpha-like n=1 Tax=Diabrotica virgifera virgifera TaxID=50390 RepID=A0ABM5K1P1_DIAVI|nr:gamma-aminobutyric acid receptor alpha-like [Diabrotica virgifera virgifera]